MIAAATGSLAATFAPFVWPPAREPGRADAVVVLSGDYGDRLAGGLRLMADGKAPTLVLVGKPDYAEVESLCRQPQAFEVVCPRPVPDNTRTEARAIGTLAGKRKWRSLILVTSRPHVSRARLLFGRCFEHRIAAVPTQPPYGRRTTAKNIAREWLAVGRALTIARGC